MSELFQPVILGKVRLANRCAMAPMVLNLATSDGRVTREYRNFYLARAQSGIGLVLVGATYVSEEGRGFKYQLGIDSDQKMGGLSDLVRDLSEWTKVGIQLSFKTSSRPPQSFTYQDIRNLRNAFALAAKRALNCGFKTVEIHACHDYCFNWFLSPILNQRSDEYGGNLENRFRLLKETVEEVRNALGGMLSLGVRLSLEDFVEGGLHLVDTLQVAKWLEGMGVDYLSASGGIGLTHYRISPPSDVARGSLLVLAKAVKETVRLPVIAAGRLDRPHLLRKAIADDLADVVAIGRALIADPYFIKKMEQGREDQIRPCLSCNQCLALLQENKPVRCAVNPLVGKDLEELPQFSTKRRVLVIGGGPAGLTSAALAARRGADVTLVERENRLGGTLNAAKVPPNKEPIGDFIEFLTREVEESGVRVLLGTEVDVTNKGLRSLHTQGYDAVIVACGAEAIVSPFDVCQSESVIGAKELLVKGAPGIGHYLVVGGGLVGLEVADHLSSIGSIVTVVEMGDRLGQGILPMRRNLILDRLIKRGVVLITHAKVRKITGKKALTELPTGCIEFGPFDWIVIACGYESKFREEEASSLPNMRIIGDAKKPRSILEAIEEAWEAVKGIA